MVYKEGQKGIFLIATKKIYDFFTILIKKIYDFFTIKRKFTMHTDPEQGDEEIPHVMAYGIKMFLIYA